MPVMKKLKIQWNNQAGSALVFTLIVMVILSLLGLSLLGVMVNHTKLSSSERSDQSAYYIAEAGAALKNAEIEAAIERYYQGGEDSEAEVKGLIQSERTYTDFDEIFGKEPEASVHIESEQPNEDQVRQYKLVSTGTIGDRSRTVEQPFIVNWIPRKGEGIHLPDQTAVYANTTIDLSGGAQIKGNIKTNSEQAPSIRLEGGAELIDGKIFVPFGSEDDALEAPKKTLEDLPQPIGQEKGTMELPDFPPIPEFPLAENGQLKGGDGRKGYIHDGMLTIRGGDDYILPLHQSTSFKEIKISSNNTLTIDLQGRNQSIVVDHLNLENGHIELKNPGRLTIYVRHKLTFGSGSTWNKTGDTENTHIYYKGQDKLLLSGSQAINGSLFADRADVEITGGGEFTGHLFTGGSNVKVDGGASSTYLIYAPHAAFRFGGGGTLKGMVVIDSFSGGGGSRIEFEEFSLDDLPFVSDGVPIDVGDIITKEPIRETDE
ncbi:DUF7305 domain-containing protein [Virgibacillus senegalensis]|uniref:DUF7305 domain-containing protein n=1 Tax=Virgibacillus senegalensis TaxID=1499679 RepID=UPI00069F9E31|nr:PilX N-terminal domain-containing pilus assembly protein [Virgibacillus senegalensis]